ncbi:MAG: hypothetical protein AAF960_30110 [Bacteroidota bacterium]
MQQLIGISLIIFGIVYFFFARRNMDKELKPNYNLVATTRRFKVSILLVVLGLLMLLGLA